MTTAFVNENAEKGLIGLAMQDALVAQEVATLDDRLFGMREMQACQRAIARLVKQGKAVDVITVDAEAQVDMQNTELLLECLNAGFSPSMSRQYIAIITECAQRRVMIQLANKLIADAGNPGASVEQLQLLCAKASEPVRDARDVVTMQDAMMSLAESFDKKDGLMTGVANLDYCIGGFQPGQLIYLGARPGVGKTSFGIAIAKYVAEHGGGVLFVSLEMTPTEIAARFMANESNVDLQKLATKRMDVEDYNAIAPLYGQLSKLPVQIEEKAVTPLQIRNAAARMKVSKTGLKLVVVDYIQLMRSGGKAGNRAEEVSAISRELKLMAMELGVTVLCMTQFNRNSEQGFGKTSRREPKMSEARDSGSIEQDANMFIILHEPDEPTDATSMQWQLYHNCAANGITWQTCRVAKNRNGAKGLINIGFDKPHMRYTCLQWEE